MRQLGSGESGLETAISYLLIAGLVISMAMLIAGLVLYYLVFGNLNIQLSDKSFFIEGKNFFAFAYNVFAAGPQNLSLWFITVGVLALLLTVYARVVLSLAYFIWRRDVRYALITAFVLVVLTLSLALH